MRVVRERSRNRGQNRLADPSFGCSLVVTVRYGPPVLSIPLRAGTLSAALCTDTRMSRARATSRAQKTRGMASESRRLSVWGHVDCEKRVSVLASRFPGRAIDGRVCTCR